MGGRGGGVILVRALPERVSGLLLPMIALGAYWRPADGLLGVDGGLPLRKDEAGGGGDGTLLVLSRVHVRTVAQVPEKKDLGGVKLFFNLVVSADVRKLSSCRPLEGCAVGISDLHERGSSVRSKQQTIDQDVLQLAQPAQSPCQRLCCIEMTLTVTSRHCEGPKREVLGLHPWLKVDADAVSRFERDGPHVGALVGRAILERFVGQDAVPPNKTHILVELE